jgi:hypothetical protein
LACAVALDAVELMLAAAAGRQDGEWRIVTPSVRASLVSWSVAGIFRGEGWLMNANTKPSARQALRAAIAVRDEAAARVREAAATMARADRLAAGARIHLHLLRDIDEQIAAHHAAAYKIFVENGGERPDISTPQHLAEKQRNRDTAQQEFAAAQAAQAELAAEHAAARLEHDRCENHVSRAADAVIAEESIHIYVRYVQAVEAARAAFDDMATISGMTVQHGPRWVDRTQLPGLPPLVARAVGMGFGHRDEPPPGERRASDRSAAWDDLRRQLRESADAALASE